MYLVFARKNNKNKNQVSLKYSDIKIDCIHYSSSSSFFFFDNFLSTRTFLIAKKNNLHCNFI